MEERAELDSILPYLPLLIGSSCRLLWPSKLVEALEAMSRGPDHSRVNCGEVFSIAISDMRASLSLPEPLAPFAPQGYTLFFDEVWPWLFWGLFWAFDFPYFLEWISGAALVWVRFRKMVCGGYSKTSQSALAVAFPFRLSLSEYTDFWIRSPHLGSTATWHGASLPGVFLCFSVLI